MSSLERRALGSWLALLEASTHTHTHTHLHTHTHCDEGAPLPVQLQSLASLEINIIIAAKLLLFQKSTSSSLPKREHLSQSQGKGDDCERQADHLEHHKNRSITRRGASQNQEHHKNKNRSITKTRASLRAPGISSAQLSVITCIYLCVI